LRHHDSLRRGNAWMREQQQRRNEGSGEQNSLAVHENYPLFGRWSSAAQQSDFGETVKPRHGNFQPAPW
jgi:hypothetical protein